VLTNDSLLTKSAYYCCLPAPTCQLPLTTYNLLPQVGGFHIFHREDLRAIAPKWLGYTRKVRAFAQRATPWSSDYLLTTDY